VYHSPLLSRHLRLLFYGQATSIPMASTCCPPIVNSYPCAPIFNMNFQSSNPPASSNAIALGSAVRFNLSEAYEPALMADHQFQLAPPARQFPPSGRTANLSDDEGTTSLRQFWPQPKQVVDLTLNDDGNGDEDDDVAEVKFTYEWTSPSDGTWS
jgi:hypothetical protein